MTGNQGEVFGQGVSDRLRVGLYARVSTHDQQTLPLQISAMREYAERRGWTVAMQIEEVGSSAKDRPARNEILHAAMRREIDIVLVWKLDRWGRSLLDLVTTLKELHAVGVNFVSLNDSLDFTTPSGQAMAGMLAVFAQYERDILRDRVKAGIAEARKNGKPHGRPPTVRELANEVNRLFSTGMSKSRIASHLGIGRTSVRRILQIDRICRNDHNK
jgi:putative DNA-invertase from lambdoid prophage Rac